jgi:hypothetical protein
MDIGESKEEKMETNQHLDDDEKVKSDEKETEKDENIKEKKGGILMLNVSLAKNLVRIKCLDTFAVL